MITHVSVRNYKSLASVDVDLGPLTVLVGQNATGKSNFIDALRFVSDVVGIGLDRAIMNRGGMGAVRRYSSKGRPTNVKVHLRFQFGDKPAEYGFELAGVKRGDYAVKYEKCSSGGRDFEVRNGELVRWTEEAPFDFESYYASYRREFGQPALVMPTPLNQFFFDVKSFLDNVGHYSIFPNRLRHVQKLWPDRRLVEDGANLSSYLRRLKRESGHAFTELMHSLSQAVPDIVDIDVQEVSDYLVVKLKYQHDGQTSVFDLSQESDGTVRLLAILTALYQDSWPSLITLEEPELTVHPGALGVLYDAIKEASTRSQIIISTHSPDLISLFAADELRVVEKIEGETHIGPMDETQRQIINDRLFSTGDLLRIQGLRAHAPEHNVD